MNLGVGLVSAIIVTPIFVHVIFQTRRNMVKLQSSNSKQTTLKIQENVFCDDFSYKGFSYFGLAADLPYSLFVLKLTLVVISLDLFLEEETQF